MKNALTRVLILLFTVCTYAQQGINYKAVIKDGSGNVVASQSITVQFQILQGAGMTNVYQETHTPTTDANGIIIINIGEGTNGVSGVFADIDWGSSNHFLNVQIDTGAGLIDLGTTGFKSVPYALQAKNALTATTAVELTGGINQAYIENLQAQLTALQAQITPAFIGELRAGGVVFWVDPTNNKHGLVCSIQDQGPSFWWNLIDKDFELTGATGTAIGTGTTNTDAIIAVHGPPVDYRGYAANVARAYSGGGFNDWYLPSIDELHQMSVNQAILEATSTANGGEGFSIDAREGYWSSSEISRTQVWIHEFFGDEYDEAKIEFKDAFEINVRAVRAF